MAFERHNGIVVTTSSSGTSDFVVDAAVPPWLDFSDVTDGATVRYAARNATQVEFGEGSWASGTSTLSRDTIFGGSNGTSPVSFSSSPTLMIAPLSQDWASTDVSGQDLDDIIDTGFYTSEGATNGPTPDVHLIVSRFDDPGETVGDGIGVLQLAGITQLETTAANNVLYMRRRIFWDNGGAWSPWTQVSSPRQPVTGGFASYSVPGDFASIQAAYDWITANLDFGGGVVLISVADGTYTSQTNIHSGWVGGGELFIKGNTSTPGNVILNATGTDATFKVTAPITGKLTLDGMELRSTTAGDGFAHFTTGPVVLERVNYGAVAWSQVAAYAAGGTIAFPNNYTISGGATRHLFARDGGKIDKPYGITVTVSGTPAFSVFAGCSAHGLIWEVGNTYSGSATGTRYNAEMNGVIFTNGGGASFYPGDSAGSTSTGGQYL